MTSQRSRLARTSLQISGFGAISVLLGLLGVQLGLLAPITAFALFALGTLICGVAGVIVGIIAIVRTRQGFGPADRRDAILATVLGVALLGLLGVAGSGGRDAPPINDITTDLTDPPAFAGPDQVAGYVDRDMSYPPDFVAVVRAHYPDLQPIRSSLPSDRAYARALASARALGWEITAESPESGRFDASDTSRVFRFVDDITVRVRPEGAGSRIDIRSKSRDGRGDLGANSERIRLFAASVQLPAVASD